MDLSIQDVIRCHLCETPLPSKHCDICHEHLCEVCEEKHISDESKEHYIVPFKMRGSTPKCLKHFSKICELHCEFCDVPICAECLTSSDHKQHEKASILKTLFRKKEFMQKDLQELEESIYPHYQNAASSIPFERAAVGKNYQKMKIFLNNKAETLHREIDIIIQKMQSDIDAMDSEDLAAINKQETTINQSIKKISQVILKVKSLLDINDIYLVSNYKSRNHEFKTLPTQLQVSDLPSLTSTKNDIDQITKQMSLLPKIKKTCQPISTVLLDAPRVLADINVREKRLFKSLNSVCFINDTDFWICQNDNMIRLSNLQGELVKSIQTKTGNHPKDIAVTRSGDLVYADYKDRSVNLVSGKQIQTLITLQGWRPYSLCSTFSGDLLVIMTNDGFKQTKVVRYSGSTEKQSIQEDAQGHPLYTSYGTEYLTENRNLDICVADCDAHAVVVVSAAGQLRFRYIGRPSYPWRPFRLVGITTDSQANILTYDDVNNCIHIIDQNGNFLRYISICGLHQPINLSTDNSDNLFITERRDVKVKKVQYFK